jgi:hypothetical protein
LTVLGKAHLGAFLNFAKKRSGRPGIEAHQHWVANREELVVGADANTREVAAMPRTAERTALWTSLCYLVLNQAVTFSSPGALQSCRQGQSSRPARKASPVFVVEDFLTGMSAHDGSPGFGLQPSTFARVGFVSGKSGHVVKCGDAPDFRLNLNLQNGLYIPCHLTIVGFDRDFRVFWPRETPSDWPRVEPASSSAANEPASE